MNLVPSVYATNQGGGAGDARINVRGFNQRNVAVMINGIPLTIWKMVGFFGLIGMALQMSRAQFRCKKV